MHLVSKSASDTQKIAKNFAEQVLAIMPRADALVIALQGDLGAGKTTFVQGFAHGLGVVELPKSPTFTIAKRYRIPKTEYILWHIDCYRLSSYKDLETIDLHSIFTDPKNIILVEWPERIGDGLPRNHITIRFEHTGSDTRAITLPELS